MTSKTDKEIVYMPGGNGAAPAAEADLLPALDDMTPREIVVELDKYIVGQAAAKRAVAVALRNRVRRQKLPPGNNVISLSVLIAMKARFLALAGGDDSGGSPRSLLR